MIGKDSSRDQAFKIDSEQPNSIGAWLKRAKKAGRPVRKPEISAVEMDIFIITGTLMPRDE